MNIYAYTSITYEPPTLCLYTYIYIVFSGLTIGFPSMCGVSEDDIENRDKLRRKKIVTILPGGTLWDYFVKLIGEALVHAGYTGQERPAVYDITINAGTEHIMDHVDEMQADGPGLTILNINLGDAMVVFTPRVGTNGSSHAVWIAAGDIYGFQDDLRQKYTHAVYQLHPSRLPITDTFETREEHVGENTIPAARDGMSLLTYIMFSCCLSMYCTYIYTYIVVYIVLLLILLFTDIRYVFTFRFGKPDETQVSTFVEYWKKTYEKRFSMWTDGPSSGAAFGNIQPVAFFSRKKKSENWKMLPNVKFRISFTKAKQAVMEVRVLDLAWVETKSGKTTRRCALLDFAEVLPTNGELGDRSESSWILTQHLTDRVACPMTSQEQLQVKSMFVPCTFNFSELYVNSALLF